MVMSARGPCRPHILHLHFPIILPPIQKTSKCDFSLGSWFQMLMFWGFVEGKMTFSSREDFPQLLLVFEKSAFEVPNFIGGGVVTRDGSYMHI